MTFRELGLKIKIAQGEFVSRESKAWWWMIYLLNRAKGEGGKGQSKKFFLPKLSRFTPLFHPIFLTMLGGRGDGDWTYFSLTSQTGRAQIRTFVFRDEGNLGGRKSRIFLDYRRSDRCYPYVFRVMFGIGLKSAKRGLKLL
jgi:hypothetical protein